MILEFTDGEVRAIRKLLGLNACSAGCAFEEIQDTDIQCDECEFPQLLNSIKEKIRKNY